MLEWPTAAAAVVVAAALAAGFGGATAAAAAAVVVGAAASYLSRTSFRSNAFVCWARFLFFLLLSAAVVVLPSSTNGRSGSLFIEARGPKFTSPSPLFTSNLL